ncbi:MAG TPA: MCP four helix bundle domain-containing protein, partial [Aquabacterium sp.]|nr:MCP four helix bundle domain-containing protein [Aquabacterium sp.]
MNIRNIRIGQRLTLGFGLVIALLLMVATLAMTRISSLSGAISEMVSETYPRTVAANEIKSELNELSRSMLSILVMSDPDQINGEMANIRKVMSSHDEHIAKLQKSITDDEGVKLVKTIVGLRDRATKAQNAFVKLIDGNAKDEAMMKYMFSVRPAQTKYFAALDQLIEQQNKHMELAGAYSAEVARNTGIFILALTLAAAAISVLIATFATRSITRPLNRAVAVAQRVARGDLTSTISSSSQDETGQLMQALHDMNESLQRIVGDVRQGTEAITTASDEIAVGNLDLSSRTEQQASSLQQTSSSMSELTQMVKQNADSARQANQLAASASQVAEQGGDVVSRVVDTMGAIDASSRKIVDIIGVIDGIAFQTNILALNAAVEAARA